MKRTAVLLVATVTLTACESKVERLQRLRTEETTKEMLVASYERRSRVDFRDEVRDSLSMLEAELALTRAKINRLLR